MALLPIARVVADRYFAEFPDDVDRYGAAARDWEVHDTQWVLAWATTPEVDLAGQIEWLARVLESRGFPLDRLARNLELVAQACVIPLPGAALELEAAAARMRERT